MYFIFTFCNTVILFIVYYIIVIFIIFTLYTYSIYIVICKHYIVNNIQTIFNTANKIILFNKKNIAIRKNCLTFF